MGGRSRRWALPRWLPTYALLVLSWSGAFAFMRLALESFTPVGIAVGRILCAAATLLIASLVVRTPLPPRRVWGRLAIYGIITATVPFVFAAYAVSHLPTTLAAIVGSTAPLWVLVIVLFFFPDERPTAWRVVGLVVGFAGMLVVLGVWHGVEPGPALGIAAGLAGAAVWALSLPYSRRYLVGGSRVGGLSPLTLSTGAFLFATASALPMLLVVSPVQGPVSLAAVVGLAGVGIVASGLAVILVLKLVKLTDATTVSSGSYLVPIGAAVIGVLAFGEHVTWNEAAGGAVILAGAAMAQGLVPLSR